MTDRPTTPLLELDPDLGQLLPDERLSAARHELRVSVRTLEAGPWDVNRLSGASREHVGLLVLDGVIAREVLVSDTISTELLGPGDVVRPWRLQDGSGLLQHTVRWNVLSRSRFALLDRRLGAELSRYPEVNAAIIDRVSERAQRLAVTQAISQLNRVDRRLLGPVLASRGALGADHRRRRGAADDALAPHARSAGGRPPPDGLNRARRARPARRAGPPR